MRGLALLATVCLVACGRSDLAGLLELTEATPPHVDAGSGNAGRAPGRPPTGGGPVPAGSAGGPGVMPPVRALDAGVMHAPDAVFPECGVLPTRRFEWPMVGHDARATGNERGLRRDAASLAGARTLWHTPPQPDNGNLAEPLIAGGRLFLPRTSSAVSEPFAVPGSSSIDWEVHDLMTGALVCELALGVTVTLTGPEGMGAALADGVLYSRTDDPFTGAASLAAFDATTGNQRWQAPGFARARWPIVAGGLVLGSGASVTGFEASTPHTTAVRVSDGNLAWEAFGTPPDGVDCPANGVALSADATWRRVAIRSECPVMGGSRRTLQVHDLTTGEPLWGYRDAGLDLVNITVVGNEVGLGVVLLLRTGLSSAGPLLFAGEGQRRLVGETMADRDMVAFDADTGEVVWQTPAHQDGVLRSVASHRALANRFVVIAANAATLSDPSLADGRSRCPGDGFGCVAGEAVGALLSGVRVETGEVAWTRELPALVMTSLAASGSLVFVALPDELLAIDSVDGSVVGQWRLSELLQPPPFEGQVPQGKLLVADGVLVMRVGDPALSALYVVSLPAAGDADAGVADADGGSEP